MSLKAATRSPQSTPTAARPPSALSASRNDRDRFVAFAFTWSDILFELDGAACIAYAGGVLEALVGRAPRDLAGIAFGDLVLSEDRVKARGLLAAVARGERIEDASIRLIGPGKTPVTVAFSGYRLPEMAGHVFIGLRGKLAHRAPADGAGRDGDSGLLKSKAFVDSICRHLAEAPSDMDRRLSLIHVVGGSMLQQQPAATSERQLLHSLGEYLRSQSVDGDLATRVACDRFGVVHDARFDVGELQNRFINFVDAAGLPANRLAIECASFEIDSAALRTEEIAKGIVYILNRFRSAQEGASELGRVRSFSKLAEQAAQAIDALKRTIARGDYNVVFQAILDAKSGDIHHYEALARFAVSDHLRTTAEHVALIEEIGLAGEFDIGMLCKVMECFSGPVVGRSDRIAVNVSGQSVNSAAYGADLARLLAENSWLRGRLLFEITESSRMDDLAAANQFVLKLRAGGHPVCLDDFGAGAANFQYLASLDVDIVKLDGPAVRCAQQHGKGVAFLKALLGLCRELGIGTVIEMVDSPTSLEFARACGADFVQGNLFGKAHPDIRLFQQIVPRNLFRR